MDNVASIILLLFLGIIIGAVAMVIFNYFKVANAQNKANKLLDDAKKEAEKHKRDTLLELKEESYKLKQQTSAEIKEKKQEIKDSEDRLISRENNLDKREEILQKRDMALEEKENNLLVKQQSLQEKEEKMDKLLKQEVEELEKISGLSKEKAHDLIMAKVESDMSLEIAEYIRDEEAKAKLIANDKAKQLIVSSMERYADDVVGTQTVSTIDLPNDEMKGRLIGREGRNIRTFESVTGVDLIIDDTPETIVISSFDPLRREIAKITIETLIKDGRIHPSRIEEVYDKTCKDVFNKITEIGNNAITDLGISKMDPELINLVGKLNFRTSYGQNALKHSIEVANLCGLMASEIGENVTLAKRAGLLHDIGKSIDFEIEGSHVEVGEQIAKKYHENETVIDAIASHHGDKSPKTIIAVLVSVADTLSAARPGARNDSLENYIKRLEQLEEIGNSFEGVEKAYAMQAGREIRVMVKPGEIDDANSYKIAREMKEKIESEMQYPGTIKITVIRETRAQEEAK
ncbi:MAG: ribonuclease Y [Bacilli bacterium]|nr:ribonuclease Y [Bacilli bacterium]MBQ8902032.1 ribonuclease Y [Bacilli bacterium]